MYHSNIAFEKIIWNIQSCFKEVSKSTLNVVMQFYLNRTLVDTLSVLTNTKTFNKVKKLYKGFEVVSKWLQRGCKELLESFFENILTGFHKYLEYDHFNK